MITGKEIQAWALEPVLPVYRATCAKCGISWITEGTRQDVIEHLVCDGWQLRDSVPWCVDCIRKTALPCQGRQSRLD